MVKNVYLLIKKYLPDIIIIIGLGILSYNVFRPSVERGILLHDFYYTNYHTGGKVLGIILIAMGIDIAIRRYIKYRENKKS